MAGRSPENSWTLDNKLESKPAARPVTDTADLDLAGDGTQLEVSDAQ
jgi:hypothetical protein